MTRVTRVTLLWSLAASVLGVTVLWGFWSRGVFALGLNAFAVAVAILGLFEWRMRREGEHVRDYAKWFIPFVLIAASFVLYENPFLKLVSVLISVPLFALFQAHERNPRAPKEEWNARYVSRLIVRSFAWFLHLRQTLNAYGALAATGRKNNVLGRALAGILIFAFIALSLVLPLLSAADPTFAAWTRAAREWFLDLFESSVVWRALLAFVATTVLAACVQAWMRPLAHLRKEGDDAQADPIIAGIIIGGMLALYLLFLGLQARSLMVGALPVEFADTERLVKHGFWQLLTLTGLNLLVCVATFGRSTRGVGRLLTAFTAASLLLLVSAAHRVWLYVAFYGFSYEKLFASYAVLFCGILLCWLLAHMFRRGRADVVRFAAFQFLWMYALLTVFPVEEFVLRANVALSRMPESQIRLYELTMLSTDALPTVERLFAAGELRENPATFSREAGAAYQGGETPRADGQADWTPWIIDQRRILGEKDWYEYTLPNIVFALEK